MTMDKTFDPAEAEARIYKWIMPDGSIQYSDRPQVQDAESVELPALQTYQAPPIPASPAPDDDDEADVGVVYESFTVSSPGPDETIRDNGGVVKIALSVSPDLSYDHLVEIKLDGKGLGSGRATNITLTNVDRGTHSVQGVIKDKSGNTISTTPAVTFHLKRASRNNN